MQLDRCAQTSKYSHFAYVHDKYHLKQWSDGGV
jgi:hypothetical protein